VKKNAYAHPTTAVGADVFGGWEPCKSDQTLFDQSKPWNGRNSMKKIFRMPLRQWATLRNA
jgi:hypothetical protein